MQTEMWFFVRSIVLLLLSFTHYSNAWNHHRFRVILPPAAFAVMKHNRHASRGERHICCSNKNIVEDNSSETMVSPSTRRRQMISTISSGVLSSVFLLPPPAARAGEVGSRIFRAVTQSDAGISVRTSIVRGAQVMDKIDGSWEQFSDRFGLGAERNKRPGRPKAKVIPEPLPLDVVTAQELLNIADDVFVSLSGVGPTVLKDEIQKVATLVKPSFLRMGIVLDGDDNDNRIKSSAQFNFVSYAHFKAYASLLTNNAKNDDIKFPSFKKSFETEVGKRILSLLYPDAIATTTASSSPPPDNNKGMALKATLKQADKLCQILRDKGFVALVERNELNEDQVDDWLDDIKGLPVTIALDGDITLGSQMLLQEQGYRLYPNFGRFALTYLFENTMGTSQQVSVDDYYFDVDYNSDPEKFEVKEVLVNIVLETM